MSSHPLLSSILVPTFLITLILGAYILSPLEEASRDPLQNAGFIITWLNNNQTTRVTSYSLRNSLDSNASVPSTPTISRIPVLESPDTPKPRVFQLGGGPSVVAPVSVPAPTTKSAVSTKIDPIQSAAQRSFASIMSFIPTSTSGQTTPTRSNTPTTPTPPPPAGLSRRKTQGLSLTLGSRPSTPSRRLTLSTILSNTAVSSSSLPSGIGGTSSSSSSTSFAAFKMLSIDPARAVRRSSSSYGGGNTSSGKGTGEYEYDYSYGTQSSEEVVGAANCQEAVDMVVDVIRRACVDVGGVAGSGSGLGGGGYLGQEFVVDEDVVGLADAQKMTSMFAKMEYGVKRLLWLGG